MSHSLLPRISVNYSAFDLLKAFFICNNTSRFTSACKAIISGYYKGENVCFTPSCRDAIYEILIRLPQKKVIIPSYTCMVVNEAVLLSGKELVYAKCDLDTFNSSYLDQIDSDSIVLATHQYGLPCNIKEIAEKCKKENAVLIEDCATSMGTIIDGQMTGTFGDYAVISLNQSKTLNVPPFGGVLIGKNAEVLKDIERTAEWNDGGSRFKIMGLIRGLAFVVSKNPMAYRLIHWLTIGRKGKLQRTEHEKPSDKKTEYYKYRFSEWQASILLRQLNRLDEIFKKRKEVYAYYDRHINNPLLTKPVHYENAVCTRYAILCEDRKSFYRKCLEHGVDMDFSHCTIGCPEKFEFEHSLAERVLNIPFYFDMSEREMRKIVDVVNKIRI